MNVWMAKHREKVLAATKTERPEWLTRVTNPKTIWETIVSNQKIYQGVYNSPELAAIVDKIYHPGSGFMPYKMVSVQPMCGPCSLIYHTQFRYKNLQEFYASTESTHKPNNKRPFEHWA